MTITSNHVEQRIRSQVTVIPRLWMLVGGIVLSPMNAVGPSTLSIGEILLLVWCSIELLHGVELRSYVALWFALLACIFLGTLWGALSEPPTSSLALLAPWLYFAFVSIVLASSLAQYRTDEIARLVKGVSLLGTLWYGLLYVHVRFIRDSVGGIPLLFGGLRYSPGSTNPHQFAILALALAFQNLSLAAHARRAGMRLFWLLLGIIDLQLGLATQSSTLIVAGLLALFCMFLAYVMRAGASPTVRIFGGFCVIGGIAFSSQLLALAVRFVESDSNGVGRTVLWPSIYDVLGQSPLFGIGPGTHAGGGVIEFHNAFLEILAMSGLVGLGLFLWMFLRVLFAVVQADVLAAGPILGVFFYGVGGFSVRRVVFWVFMAFAIAFYQRNAVGIPDRRL